MSSLYSLLSTGDRSHRPVVPAVRGEQTGFSLLIAARRRWGTRWGRAKWAVMGCYLAFVAGTSALLQFELGQLGPTPHQALAFGISAIAALDLVLTLLLVLRLPQAKAQRRRDLDACQAERERIARDMHDSLLQGTQALLFRLQMWEEYPAIPPELRYEIARIVRQTRAVVVESRERILMTRRPPSADLPEALGAIGDETSAGRTATFNVSVAGEARSLSAEAKDQLLQIAREAVRNACRHAQASRIAVSLRYNRRSLLMCIVDDGRGIDPTVAQRRSAATHFGLTGMRERSAQLGGHLRIYSRPGMGMRVELRVPASMVYEDACGGFWQHKGRGLLLPANSYLIERLRMLRNFDLQARLSWRRFIPFSGPQPRVPGVSIN